MLKNMILAGAMSLLAAAAAAMPAFDDWSTPASIETLPWSATNLNGPAVDGCASLSPDGLTLAFNSNRTGNFDIYVATRESTSDGFGPAQRLPAPVNGPSTDSCPTLLHGKRMIFTSFRDDPAGDLYETRLGPKGWSAPRRFGPNINTPGVQEESAALYEDEQGREVMVFSRRGGGSDGKIYQSIDGAPATLVQGGPHSSAADNRPSVTHDGLTIFFDSTRSGTVGAQDVYYATRPSTSEPFGSAVNLGPSFNSSAFDARPFISWDGTMLTFSSQRPGGESAAPDIWFATRDRANGH